MIAALVIWTLACLAVLHLRDMALGQAENNLRNLTRAVTAQTEVVLMGADAALDAIRYQLDNDSGDIAGVLRREADSAPFLQEISVYDAQGQLTYLARQPMPAVPVNFSDRAWFAKVREAAPRAMVVGDPVRSKINNKWLMPLAMRRGQPGAFTGAVAASLDPAFFQALFSEFDLGEGSAITLQRADSTILARQPHREDAVGKEFPGPIYLALQGRRDALVRATSIVDGSERLISGRHVGQYPVYVAISVTWASVMQGWREQTTMILAAAALLSALIAVLAQAHARQARYLAARQQAEEALREKVDALRATTHRLEEQAAELGRSNADLEQFAYVASHDLREPLRMVTNFLALAERHLGDALDAETREYIDFAVDGARRMDHLITDLLQYARIGRECEEKQPIAAAAAIAEALANLSVQAEECDAERKPIIAVSATRQGAMVEFTIQDNGIGIPPEECERIFGIFKRLHGSGAYQGTGIGLAVCRKIVDSHGGRIRAESAGPGAGTTFRFTLPMAN